MYYLYLFLFIFSTCSFASDFYTEDKDNSEKHQILRAFHDTKIKKYISLNYENEDKIIHLKSKYCGTKSSYDYVVGFLEMKNKFPCSDFFNNDILKALCTNFKVTENPKKGDIAIYYTSNGKPEKNSDFGHFGIYMGEYTVEEKKPVKKVINQKNSEPILIHTGEYTVEEKKKVKVESLLVDLVCLHDLFAVPHIYGNYVLYWTPIKEMPWKKTNMIEKKTSYIKEMYKN